MDHRDDLELPSARFVITRWVSRACRRAEFRRGAPIPELIARQLRLGNEPMSVGARGLSPLWCSNVLEATFAPGVSVTLPTFIVLVELAGAVQCGAAGLGIRLFVGQFPAPSPHAAKDASVPGNSFDASSLRSAA